MFRNHNSPSLRSVIINVRARANQRDMMIDKAADALGKNRSDFMLEAACREADNVLLDRRYFTLSEEQFEVFTALLDSPRKQMKDFASFWRRKLPGSEYT